MLFQKENKMNQMNQETLKVEPCCMCRRPAVREVPSVINSKKTTELLCHKCYLNNFEAESYY